MSTKVEIKNSRGIPYFLIIVLILVGFFGYSYYTKYKAVLVERDAYSNNVYALQNELKRVKVNDSIEAAQVYALSLSESDYKRLYADEIARNKKLVKHIDQIQSVASVSATVRDTVYVPSEYVDGKLHAEYKNNWVAIDVQELEKDTRISYKYRLDLEIINHIDQKRFLFWKYGVKSEKLTLYGKDPNLDIGNVKYKKILH